MDEKLSKIFLQLHISEKSGWEVPKITEIYGKEAFISRENSIVVTIPLERIRKVGNKAPNKIGNKKPLNVRRIKILTEMRDNPNITAEKLHKIFGISKMAVDNNTSFCVKMAILRELAQKNQGISYFLESIQNTLKI